MVDNEEFIAWASTSNNPDYDEWNVALEEDVELSDWVKEKFYTRHGAEVAKSAKMVKEKLSAMFWLRVNYGLEFAAIEDEMRFPEIETCSLVTRNAGWEIRNAIYDGVSYSLDLMNMESFLGNVSDWLEQKYD